MNNNNNNILGFIVFIALCTNGNAISLKNSVERVININPAIVAEHKNQDAFRKYVDQEEGDYYPTLDLTSFYEESHTYNNPDDAAKNDSHKNGWNTALKLEQILYDGGLTPSEMDEYQHRYGANKFRSNLAIENIILATTNTYLDLIQYKELKRLSVDMIKVHEQNLVTAKEKEQISGEKLETFQVSSKLYFVKESLYEQEDSSLKANYGFKRYVGIMPDDKVCRPIINKSIIPKSLEKAVKLGMRKNFSILEQIENIKVQREKLTQANAKFLPTLLFQLQGTWDDDLSLAENGRKDIYRARLFMSWNLYEGGKDRIASQRETIFLQESKKSLDSITNEVVNSISNAYSSFQNYESRVEMLKGYVTENKNILDVYIKEFDAGTRTFIDILNAESELYSSRSSLIEREFDLIASYYNLLSELSVLSDSILTSQNQSCNIINKNNMVEEQKQKEIELDEDLEELFDASEKSSKIEKVNKQPADILEELDYEYSTGDRSNNTTVQPNKIVKEVVKTTQLSTTNLPEFMKSSDEYFTLNITTEAGLIAAKHVLRKYDLVDNGITYNYGNDLSKSKVLYGIYSTYKEAKIALANLNTAVVDRHKPYIDSLNKHQKLYNKYN